MLFRSEKRPQGLKSSSLISIRPFAAEGFKLQLDMPFHSLRRLYARLNAKHGIERAPYLAFRSLRRLYARLHRHGHGNRKLNQVRDAHIKSADTQQFRSAFGIAMQRHRRATAA